MAVGSVRDFGTQKGRRALLSDAMVAVASHHHSSVAENRRTKSGFSFANGDCVTHMRQGFPLQRFFAAPSRSICPAAPSQPPAAQQQAADEQARKEADEKAWADAEKTGAARR
jgi:hypothetical protein